MKASPSVTIFLRLILAFGPPALLGCAEDSSSEAQGESEQRAQVESALDAFVADLVTEPTTDAAELTARIRAYLDAHPGFFGSTVALIGNDGFVTTSPYVYRGPDGLLEKELAVPGYDIDEQAWLTGPRDSKQALWSEPYFDAGGGEIWMVTRSVPIVDENVVTAVATTDLPIAQPEN